MATVRTAWVLAGGGSLGAVQVGMMRALVAAGEHPDLLVGASVGAINSAYFAAFPDADGVERLADIWLSLRQQDVFPLSLLGSLHALLTGRSHLLPDTALRALIRRALPFSQLEQARVPLHVMTTDLLSGAEVLLSTGPAEPALLASAAIPAVFPAVQHQSHCLVDGGVASNAPVASAVRLGAQKVVVLPTGFGCACPSAPTGLA
ncbi:MAG: patatin-like phospholipase family protein, partial [Perlucidibaca sp.]